MEPAATPDTTEATGARWPRLATALVIVAATLLAYANSFGASFHFDDHGVIVQPGRIHDLEGLWPPSGRRWVGDLTFALNYRVGGLSVTGYHVVNVAIHAAAALLVAALAAVTLRTPAARAGRVGPLVGRYLPLAAGLLFAVHPLATQAVTYVVQRYASLATLLYVLALVLYARARLAHLSAGRATARVVALGAGALVAAAAAMATKEISVTLPLAAAGYDLAFLRGGRRWPLLAPLAALAALPLLDPALEGHLASEAPLPAGPYALTQARVVVAYLRLLAWPSGQNVDHDVALSTSLAEPAVLGALALLLALAAVAAVLLARGRRGGRVEWLLVGGGIAWFFLTLSVESSVLPLKDPMFEHRAYLPSVGALLAAATLLLMGLERLPLPGPGGRRVAAALALVAVPLGVATFRRNAVWRDDVTLWADAVAKSPGKARPRQFLGTALAERGELDAAEAELRRALELRPGYRDALFNLGSVYMQKEQPMQAMVAFTLAVQAAPADALSHYGLGAALHELGQGERAAAAYLEALRLDPGLREARRNLELLRAPGP